MQPAGEPGCCGDNISDSPPRGTLDIFSIHNFYLAIFFLPDFEDITIPSQKLRNGKWGDVYSSSVLGNRCSLLSAIW